MKASAVYNDAFLVCHEIYAAARELVNSRVPTTQLTSASKFLWRPDLRPRLVEYVADFARCGERALGETSLGRKNAVICTALFGSTCRTPKAPSSRESRGHRELSRVTKVHAAFAVGKFPRASRLILFRVYYLGGAEYEAARHLLGISERTWSDWAEEIRQRVGAELLRAQMYPPGRYFRQATPPGAAAQAGTSGEGASTNDAREAKIQPVDSEQDFD